MSSRSLFQRRSSSPLQHHVDSSEEFVSLVEKGTLSLPILTQRTDDSYKKDRVIGTKLKGLFWSIAKGSAMLLAVFFAIAAAYWLALYIGLYNPESDCPVPTFDYPDCSNALMHVGEVDPPNTSRQWLEWREGYHRAMSVVGRGALTSFAEDWREPNTTGFTDPSSLEFKYSSGMGRAVFTTKAIPKGAKIWDSRYRAVVPNGCVARLWYANMTDQQKCDSVFWGYVNNFYGNGMAYMIDLDGHGYINHHEQPNTIHHFEGELDTDWYGVSRVRLPYFGIFPLSREDWQRRNRPGSYGLYATRDIQAGEEIFYDYEEIYMKGWIDWFTIFLERSLPLSEWETI